MTTNKDGGAGAAAALDAATGKVADEIAPKLARLRSAEVSAGELREEVADLKQAADGLTAEVAEVRRAVRATREKRERSEGGVED